MKRLRLRRRKAVFLALSFILSCLVYKYAFPFQVHLQDLLSLELCPACYGENLCNTIETGQITLTGSSKFKFSRILNERNVFYGYSKERKHEIVLKQLGPDRELKQLDKQICSMSGVQPCNPVQGIEKLVSELKMPKTDLQGLDKGELSTVTLSWEKIKDKNWFQDTDIFRCTAQQSEVDFLVHSVIHHSSRPTLENIISILLINQEPLVSMMFNRKDGWPFPEYLGSCGRLAVFEYIGPSIAAHYSSSWPLRAYFAVQLLQLAKRFSKPDISGLVIYPTDWSAHNFAVDEKNRLYLVDLEGIILVNQSLIREKKAPGWDTYYTADRFGCTNCFSFSTADLCTHAQSDHNYHGVCGGLLAPQPYSPGLAGGLLHSVPRHILARHPLLPRLLDECWKSSKPGGREEAADLIIEILRSELVDLDLQHLT